METLHLLNPRSRITKCNFEFECNVRFQLNACFTVHQDVGSSRPRVNLKPLSRNVSRTGNKVSCCRNNATKSHFAMAIN